MNTRVFIKEGRPLFWPWCAIMLTSLLSLIRSFHSIEWVGLLGVVLGVPLLATLPFGNEFQNRTLSLLLSQPVGRVRIWAEKSVIAFAAVASVVLVFAFSPLIAETVPDRGEQAYAVALAVAVLASATFWTLIARSTIGGIALSVGTVLVIIALVSAATGFGGSSLFLTLHFTAVRVATLLCYAGVMLWLGERRLAQYQVTGGMAGDDLLTTSSEAILGAFPGRARSNPTQPILNLIGKEPRLLRPVWLITVLTALTWTCLAFSDLARQQKTPETLSLPIIAFGFASAAIIAILAGCLSLGEEKTSGTYAWHRTLPISAARQWSIKLFAALFVSLVCAGAIPLLLLTAGGHLFPSAFSRGPAHFQLFWLLGGLFLTLFSFWCACAVNGTVAAVAWIVPILAFAMVIPQIAVWAGAQFVDLLDVKFSVFADFRLTVFLSDLGRHDVSRIIDPFNPGTMTSGQLIFWIPTLILAVVQSYRMFGTPIRPSALAVARKLSPLIVLALLCTVFTYAFVRLAGTAEDRVYGPIASMTSAIQVVLSNSANREATQPLQMTVGDLNTFSTLRVPLVPWLHDAIIAIAPDKAHPTTCCQDAKYFKGKPVWNYTASLHLANGAVVNLSLEPTARQLARARADFPKRTISIRWPGENTEQTLRY